MRPKTPILLGLTLLVSLFFQSAIAVATEIDSVSIGFKGILKLGYWVPAKIRVKGEVPKDLSVEIALPDTDGIQTTFRDDNPYIRDMGEFKLIETQVKLGRSKGLVQIRLKSGDDDGIKVIAEKQMPVGEFGTPLNALVELYGSLGRSVEIQGAVNIGGRNEYAQGQAFAFNAEEVLEGRFANHWKSMESIDGIILEAGSFADSPLPFSVQTALAAWVNNGGRLAITGGAKLKEFLEKNPEIGELIKGEVLGSRRLTSSSAIERAVKAADAVSGQRDRPFCALLRGNPGKVLIQEGEDPVLIRQMAGFGQVLIMTVNLADEPLAKWNDRKSLSAYLITELNRRPENRRSGEVRVTRFGFQDFSGQLRSALDDFAGVSSVNFTVVAAIAILFICLIGPVDYFLLKRLTNKMELTWITFSLMVLLTCLLTYWISSSTKSSKMLCRQVEVVDIDSQTQLARGTAWSHVYAPSSGKYEVQWKPGESIRTPVQFGSWFGFPGDALGGMDNQSVNSSKSSYVVDIRRAELDGLPINVASTKGIQLDWIGKANLKEANSLSVVRNSLAGRVVNPLPVELENVFVVYRKSIYQFKRKLGPGDSFDLEEDSRERSLADYLNVRKVRDLGTEATPWNISESNLRRILEVMMFYEGAGGRGYVNLFQRYLNRIDFSDIAEDERAILVGRTSTPGNRLVVDGNELDDEYEESWTYYRILIPVSAKQKNQ